MSAPTSLARRLESLAEACAGGGAGPAIALCAVRDRESALLCRGRVDEHTRFELGSVTKTFTALLLAEMAARGDVRYHDPISTYLPAGALPRGAYGARITLHDLATHTSGLPRVPLDLLLTAVSRWWTNPYATYSPERMLRSTARARIRRGPTTRPHYSNLGAGLLGHILGIAAGTGYPKALTTRVLEPLGLAHTTLDPDQPQATGHRHGRPRPAWRDPGLAAAGALRSTASDLLRYLQAHLTPDDTRPATLRTALREVTLPRVGPPEGDQLALIWNLRPLDTHDLLFHAGATRGFTTFIGFSPRTHTGLAALTNTTPTFGNKFVQTAYLELRTLRVRVC